MQERLLRDGAGLVIGAGVGACTGLIGGCVLSFFVCGSKTTDESVLRLGNEIQLSGLSAGTGVGLVLGMLVAFRGASGR